VVAGLAQHILQNGANQSEFGIEVGLQGINGGSGGQGSSGSGGPMSVLAMVVLVGMIVGCGLGFLFTAKKDPQEDCAVGCRGLMRSLTPWSRAS
jgi:hypothetical protein